MINFNAEVIEKAKTGKSAEELLEIAKANDIEITVDEAAIYFAQLNPKIGELSDDDLDAVAGGSCQSKSSGRTVVSPACKCFTGQYENIYSGLGPANCVMLRTDNEFLRKTWINNAYGTKRCGNCLHLEFEVGTGVCGKTGK